MFRKKFNVLVFIIIALSGVIVLVSSCGKDNKDGVIPYVYVNFSIYPNSTEYIDLNTVNNSVYLTGGNKGIIVFRKSADEFMAYDRTCPYDPDVKEAIIEVTQQGSLIAIDSCCGSKFLLTDGSPIKGPATLPLKQYHTAYDGDILHIFN